MKKLTVLLTVIALVSCLGSFVFAAESEAMTTTAAITTASITTSEEANTATTESAAEWFVNGIIDNLDKILAGIGGIISMIVLILQKSTIIPKQNAFVDNTSKTFTQLAKDLSTFQSEIHGNIDVTTANVAAALGKIGEVVKKVEELERDKLLKSENEKHFRDSLVNVADMLNTIIQASTLSQWKKDEVGEMHKAAISAANSITEDGDAA